MRLEILAGGGALITALAYGAGFVLLLGVLAPLGYGGSAVSPIGVIAFHQAHPGLLPLWNGIIYELSALGLALLGLALARICHEDQPHLALFSGALVVLWAGFSLASGMIARASLAEAALWAPTDPAKAAQIWHVMHLVETALSGRTESLGGLWIGLASVMAARQSLIPGALAMIGALIALAGLATYLPSLSEPGGAIFGMGAILWFCWTGAELIRAGYAGSRGV
ncbi:MAG: hypothetical protein OIF40_07030 [Mangrovicoccus sp.]|nr:hypothetical protein [Mangrovicoccus sp.]